MRFIVFLLIVSFFTEFVIENINAEEVRNAYTNTQYVNLSEYSQETYMENGSKIQEDIFNKRMMTENLILKCSLIITIILFGTYLLILLRKYKSLKKNEAGKDNIRADIIKEIEINKCNDISLDDIHNEAICMFRHIDKTMREKKPYLNIEFSRETMIRMFNTNKNKLNEAIIAGSGMSYSKYICELRLQESINILKEDTNILLNDLAMRCGFNTYSSFYRSFCKRFGMSPADFKHEYIKNNVIVDND